MKFTASFSGVSASASNGGRRCPRYVIGSKVSINAWSPSSAAMTGYSVVVIIAPEPWTSNRCTACARSFRFAASLIGSASG